MKGTFEHSLTKAMWKLPNSTEMLSEYNEKIKKAKSLYKTRVFVPAVEFSTSDVGVCSATITIALVDDVDGYELVLSSPIRIEHRSGKELSDFEDSLDDVSDQLQDSIDAMSKMLDIEIADVVETAHIMIKKDITRIGLRPLTKAVQKLYDQNGGEKVYKGTAHDVFLLLHDAFSIMRNEGRKMNQKTLELVGNNIAKLVSPNFKWDKYSVNKTKK